MDAQEHVPAEVMPDPANEQGREVLGRCQPTFSCAAGRPPGEGDPDEPPPF
jgi:hypothetical protein